MLKTLNKWIFYTALAALVPAFLWRNSFPEPAERQYGTIPAPDQAPADKAGFRVNYGGVDYSVEPRYRYELTGLVVSSAFHNARYGLHRRWNDHLNVADLCVVWGDNAGKLDLNALDFWNGQFTCNFSTRDDQVWRAFNKNELSNNHLLTEDDWLRDRIQSVEIGDVIHLRGWLSRYANDQGFSRDTSTTREDTGNGACETIYVEQFDIVGAMTTGWRTLWSVALSAAIGSALLWLVAVGRGKW